MPKIDVITSIDFPDTLDASLKKSLLELAQLLWNSGLYQYFDPILNDYVRNLPVPPPPPAKDSEAAKEALRQMFQTGHSRFQTGLRHTTSIKVEDKPTQPQLAERVTSPKADGKETTQ